MPLNLNYFYGEEAEQYCFYRIPKVLFTDVHFKSVPVEAKVLYGLLLDRMALSVRNGWLDDDGRVYIYFTMEDAMEQMNCGKDKIVKLFKELDAATGIGLIERRKQGLGRPTIIYVKNFILPTQPGDPVSEPTPDLPPKPERPAPSPEGPTPTVQTSEKPKSGLRHSAEVLTSENPKSGIRKSRSLDCGKTDSNNTEKKETDMNDTDAVSSIPPLPPTSERTLMPRERMRMDEMDLYREIIKENIDFDILLEEHPYSHEILEGYLELMVETCCSKRKYIRIGGEDFPAEIVRSRLLKLTSEHISYVLESLQNNTTKIGNIKAYTLTALYNAPTTMGQYYTSQVSHDMALGFG